MKPRSLSSVMLRAAVAITLVNAPFWWLGQNLLMNRALINIDALVAAAVMTVLPWIGAVLLALAWAADMAISQSLTYHFGTPLDFLNSLRFASALNLRETLDHSMAMLVLPFLGAAVALRIVPWRGPRVGVVVAGLAMLLTGIDTVNGSSALSTRDHWRLPINLAGSPLTTLVNLQARGSQAQALRPIPIGDTVQGLIDIPTWAAEHPQRSVLLVIVESLGRPEAEELGRWLDAQLIGSERMADRFSMHASSLPFRGSTTSGELRSLCALAGSYRSVDAEAGARCLPARLARQGMVTVGLHGFSSRMFDRQTWWPKIGLNSTRFIDAMPPQAGRTCGSTFKGGCDDDWIAAAIESVEPPGRFAYLLTLNTHLPVLAVQPTEDLARICASLMTPQEACEFIASVGHVLGSLRRRLEAVKTAPLVIVVGDHAPPFSIKASRSAFDPERLPAYLLVPREAGGPGTAGAIAATAMGQAPAASSAR